MKKKKMIRVLIVDDSMVFRETIATEISKDPIIEVVATASDPYMARDKIIELEPDVMVLDVEIPKMNGIDFLKKLMPQYPMPVVVISAISENVFDALKSGAVDFVTKPDGKKTNSMEYFSSELIVKIKIASTANVSHHKKIERCVVSADKSETRCRMIAIGASTGGTEAVDSILKSLHTETPGIVIVQHMPPVFTNMYAKRLNNNSKLQVKEAETGDIIRPGMAFVAPGDRHMRIIKKGALYQIECFFAERVNGHCPSVDVLFESVAKEVGRNSVGIILTGMGNDGAKGLLEMRKKGARTLGQDENSSIVYGMPKVAYEIGAVERQSSLENMAQAMYSLL